MIAIAVDGAAWLAFLLHRDRGPAWGPGEPLSGIADDVRSATGIKTGAPSARLPPGPGE